MMPSQRSPSICVAFLAAVAIVLVSCSSDVATVDANTEFDTADSDTNTTGSDAASETTEDGNASDGEALDITNQTLTSSATSCTAYVGTYRSEITDQSNNTMFMGETTITDDGGVCTLKTNSIPNHDVSVDGRFATTTAEVDATYEISTSPVFNDEPTQLDFQVNAVMINGIIWEAFPAACFGVGDQPLGEEAIGCGGRQLENPWRYNVGSTLNRFGVDAFYAHTQPTGLYHYHGTPTALYDIDCAGADPSPVIGFARDGFPIFGPCFLDESGEVRTAASSYVLRDGVRVDVDGYTTPYTVGASVSDEYNGQFIGDFEYTDGAGDLDECNGMVVNDTYGYFVTSDYPYLMACYWGDPSSNFG